MLEAPSVFNSVDLALGRRHFDMVIQLMGKVVLIAGGACPLITALTSRLTADGATVRCEKPDFDACTSLGRVDVLLNVIPPIPQGAFLDLSQSDWERCLAATLGSAFRWSQAVGRAMSLSGYQGTVINIVREADSDEAAFALFAPMMRRGCTIAFTQALAAEFADRLIRVNAIVSHEADQDASTTGHASEELIQATLFLCAAHGAPVSGEIIHVGGTVRRWP